jgi:hypothetical protein
MGKKMPKEMKLAIKLMRKESLDISNHIIHVRDKAQKKKNRTLLTRIFTEAKHASVKVHCNWCKEEVFRNALPDNRGNKCVQRNNTATVDHIYDRRDIRRYLVTEEENTVIACYKCNQERNDESIQSRKYVFVGEIIELVNLC